MPYKVKKTGKGYSLSAKGKTFGTHKTKSGATRQMRAIEASKARKK